MNKSVIIDPAPMAESMRIALAAVHQVDPARVEVLTVSAFQGLTPVVTICVRLDGYAAPPEWREFVERTMGAAGELIAEKRRLNGLLEEMWRPMPRVEFNARYWLFRANVYAGPEWIARLWKRLATDRLRVTLWFLRKALP